MTTDNDSTAAPPELSAQQVAEYLLEHTQFFRQHSSILAELELPHESGKAISLVEKQVSVLRERNRDTRDRLNQLMEGARDNERLFNSTQQLVLGLLEATSLDDIVHIVQSTLRDDYRVDSNALVLLGNPDSYNDTNVRIIPPQVAATQIGHLLETSRAVCGTFRDSELAFLFPDATQRIGSAAIVPLRDGDVFGILAIGSFDPHYYRSSMGTVFLGYIGEVLNRIIPRYLVS